MSLGDVEHAYCKPARYFGVNPSLLALDKVPQIGKLAGQQQRLIQRQCIHRLSPDTIR
jgi:hypothetical protein